MEAGITIRQQDHPTPDDLDYVSRRFRAYNDQQGGRFPSKELRLFAYAENGQIIGGLFGVVSWGWLHVDVLWVAEAHRRSGIGSSLMDRSEAEALAMGVGRAYLETTDFQAVGFYEQRGYEIFAQLEDQPPGHVCCYMKNRSISPKT
jgi:GNAT superfamily N-acetyltransferase